MEAKKRREQEEKQKKIQEELYYEQKLVKDRLELELRQQQEKQKNENKLFETKQQNQQIIESKKTQQNEQIQIQELTNEVNALQQIDNGKVKDKVKKKKKEKSMKNEVQGEDLSEEKLQKQVINLKKTFKGELQIMKSSMMNQDQILKEELQKMLETTLKQEQERKQALEEVQRLKEQVEKQKKQYEEDRWEQISRGQHWQNYKGQDQEKKRILESGINLKRINTNGYFGVTGIHEPKVKQDQLYQSSRKLNLSNQAIDTSENQAEMIRSQNLDRLRLLHSHQQKQSYNQEMVFMNYSEKEQELLQDRLMRIDAPLYKLLNPQLEKIKAKSVPYHLNSTYDYCDPYDIKEQMKEEITQKSYLIQ